MSDYIEKLSTIGSMGVNIYFRGHKDERYRIQPSVFRKDLMVKKSENIILRELMSFHPEEFVGHRSAFESLVQAQHHGLPTRLLDVSLSSIAGLFFATEANDDGTDTVDGAVIRFDVDSTRIKGFESDTLSCICNLAKLNHAEKEEIRSFIMLERKRKDLVKKINVDEFNELEAVRRLVQFVRQEKPYFENKIQPIDLYSNYLALPMRNNKRITAQSGAFIVSGVLSHLAKSSKFSMKKFVVPKKLKPLFREELDRMGVNRMTMFPDLQSSAKYITSKHKSP
ncbi:FRG domain-containing protein [Roseovarius lutimaris]|uniref:FRG domain-containing protein n=1 Tax=Roseovarius lutimaris TaxID=1005928 RepID=UPI0015A6D58E|nr:FRG domain-containing protein [Roseovarius lutimaris]